MEVYSSGSRRSKYVSPAQMQRMKNGGRKADQISKLANAHHLEHELPEAEKVLDTKIKSVYKKKKKANQGLQKMKSKSFFQKIKDFIQTIFYPVKR